MDRGRPPMGVALLGRQLRKDSHSIAKRRDDAVGANQFERQWCGAKQSGSPALAAYPPGFEAAL